MAKGLDILLEKVKTIVSLALGYEMSSLFNNLDVGS